MKKVRASKLRCFDSFLTTLEDRLDDIANYFIHRHTSGFVEGFNNKLKVVKRRCYGILNVTHLFQRIHLDFIGKYLSSLDPLYHTLMFKEGFEAQLRASRLSISCGMRALGMAREIRNGHLQGVIQPHDVPGFQGLDNPA